MERCYYYVWQWNKNGCVYMSSAVMKRNGNFSMEAAIEAQKELGHNNGVLIFWSEIDSSDFEYMSNELVKTLD